MKGIPLALLICQITETSLSSFSMEESRITSLSQFIDLWQGIYRLDGRPCWDGILPYYHEDIHFRDSVQEIQGIAPFSAMTRRLAERSKNLEFVIHNAVMEHNTIFIEWEMIIAYKRYPKSSVYGSSRIVLRDGKVADQRDYYDLWGDIFDNIPGFGRLYRSFMRRRFG